MPIFLEIIFHSLAIASVWLVVTSVGNFMLVSTISTNAVPHWVDPS